MRKILGLICLFLGIACLLAAAGFFIANWVEADRAGTASAEVLSKLQALVPDTASQKPAQTPDSVSGSPYAPVSQTRTMTVREVDGYGYIGYLTVPTLDLTLPVMSEWDYTRLKTAPCRYFGSVWTDDLVIAAHSYPRHFGSLSSLQIGDPITFTDMDGNVHLYRVGDMEQLAPSAVESMVTSDWDLTLYTCTPNGRLRFTVRCERVEKT